MCMLCNKQEVNFKRFTVMLEEKGRVRNDLKYSTSMKFSKYFIYYKTLWQIGSYVFKSNLSLPTFFHSSYQPI